MIYRPDVKPLEFYPLDENKYYIAVEDICCDNPDIQRFFLKRNDGGSDDIIEFKYAAYFDKDMLYNKFGIQIVDKYADGLPVLIDGYITDEFKEFKKVLLEFIELPINDARKMVLQLGDYEYKTLVSYYKKYTGKIL